MEFSMKPTSLRPAPLTECRFYLLPKKWFIIEALVSL
jgi:hypothetical protein